MKLGDREIAAIRERRAAGEKLYSLACDFGVHESTISSVCRHAVRPTFVVGEAGITPWMAERIESPSYKWCHMRSYRSRDYAAGVCVVLAAKFPHLAWTVTNTAVWMRLPKPRVIAAQGAA